MKNKKVKIKVTEQDIVEGIQCDCMALPCCSCGEKSG
jgi:hypothetical protein